MRPQDALLMAGHLAACGSCSAYAQQLRDVDALLSGVRQLEPPADFTPAVMAKIAALPRPAPARVRWWWVGAAVAAEWLTLVVLNSLHVVSFSKLAAGSGAFAFKVAKLLEAMYDVAQHFIVTTYAAIGAALEITALIALAVGLRKYFMRRGAPLWKATTL